MGDDVGDAMAGIGDDEAAFARAGLDLEFFDEVVVLLQDGGSDDESGAFDGLEEGLGGGGFEQNVHGAIGTEDGGGE